MRMDIGQKITAVDLVNTASAERLAEIFRTYGEERYGKRIAQAVVEARQQEPILTTARLAEIVKLAHPRWEKHKHPATRVFLALRIAVNHELAEVEEVLEQCLEALRSKGRLAVIAFHSLEDRLVKEFMHAHVTGSAVPAGVPLRHEQLPLRLRRIGRLARASAAEVKRNPRSRSAILRIVEKIK
jgi:16S rRNA (cytosine1402-N4)-methyltransferase